MSEEKKDQQDLEIAEEDLEDVSGGAGRTDKVTKCGVETLDVPTSIDIPESIDTSKLLVALR